MSLEDLECNESMLDITDPNITTGATTSTHPPAARGEQLALSRGLGVFSLQDRVMLDDRRVMSNMMAAEKDWRCIDYCALVQTQIKPHMRKIVVDWMVEVCEDQQCQANVVHAAVQLLDKFLCKRNIKKMQFQLVATVRRIFY